MKGLVWRITKENMHENLNFFFFFFFVFALIFYFIVTAIDKT